MLLLSKKTTTNYKIGIIFSYHKNNFKNVAFLYSALKSVNVNVTLQLRSVSASCSFLHDEKTAKKTGSACVNAGDVQHAIENSGKHRQKT